MGSSAAMFDNASLTKALFIASTGGSTLWQAAKLDAGEPLNGFVSSLVRSFVFQNTGDFLVGMGLIYHFRMFERRMGSSKFGGYAFVVMTLSYGLQKALEIAYGFQNVPTGPYGFIFATFVQFFFDVPRTRRILFFGIPMSNKALIYLMGLKLMFSHGTGSVVAALCGILAGLTYRSKILKIDKFRFPKAVNWLLSQSFGRLLGGTSGQPIVTIHAPRGNRQRGQQPPNNGAMPSGDPPVRAEASPAAVRQLISMGFNEAQARRALQFTNNDVPSAIAMLIDQS